MSWTKTEKREITCMLTLEYPLGQRTWSRNEVTAENTANPVPKLRHRTQ